VIRKKDREEFLYIESKNYSLEHKTEEILDILDTEGFLDFNRYADGLDTIEEVLISFFAILEMVKRHLVVAVQKRLFDTISVWKQERAATTQ
jgi:chromatin segregation and condensation protein Rec8/ScpA/Scc1 (kleisin family)